MTNKNTSVPPSETAPADVPPDPTRRRLLGGAAVAGAALAAGCAPGMPRPASGGARATDDDLDALLHRHIRHVVVIYAENRSFNNLFADFPGLQQPLAAMAPEQTAQRDGQARTGHGRLRNG